MTDFRKHRTDLIIFHAFNQLLEHELFSNLTVNQIAKHSLVHRNTFYHHFEDKYDLLHRYILFSLSQVNQSIAVDQFSKRPFHIIHQLYTSSYQHQFQIQRHDAEFMQIFSTSFVETFVHSSDDYDNIWAMGKISAILTWNRLGGNKYDMFADYGLLDHIFITQQFPQP